MGDADECNFCEINLFDAASRTRDFVVKFLVLHGIFKAVVECSSCRRPCRLDLDTLMFRCHRKMQVRNNKRPTYCRFKKSARVGSFFAGSKLALETYFRMIAVFLHLKPPRQAFIMRELGVSAHSVVEWYRFCREVFVSHMVETSERIGGPLTLVEIIDEAKFIGKRKYNRGRRVDRQWVFGGVERGSGKSFLVPVEARDAQTLLAVIKKWILPGTTIISNCWKAYDCLSCEDFQQLTVNHSINFDDPDNGANTNIVERAWRGMRSTIPHYGVQKDHFVGYLAEYHFKRRYPIHCQRIHHFFCAAAKLYPPTH